MKKSDLIIILLLVIILVLIFIVAPSKGFTTLQGGSVSVIGIQNNTAQGKVYLNDTIFANSTARFKGHVIMGKLAGTYTGGSAFVCVYDNGTLYTAEVIC